MVDAIAPLFAQPFSTAASREVAQPMWVGTAAAPLRHTLAEPVATRLVTAPTPANPLHEPRDRAGGVALSAGEPAPAASAQGVIRAEIEAFWLWQHMTASGRSAVLAVLAEHGRSLTRDQYDTARPSLDAAEGAINFFDRLFAEARGTNAATTTGVDNRSEESVPPPADVQRTRSAEPVGTQSGAVEPQTPDGTAIEEFWLWQHMTASGRAAIEAAMEAHGGVLTRQQYEHLRPSVDPAATNFFEQLFAEADQAFTAGQNVQPQESSRAWPDPMATRPLGAPTVSGPVPGSVYLGGTRPRAVNSYTLTFSHGQTISAHYAAELNPAAREGRHPIQPAKLARILSRVPRLAIEQIDEINMLPAQPSYLRAGDPNPYLMSATVGRKINIYPVQLDGYGDPTYMITHEVGHLVTNNGWLRTDGWALYERAMEERGAHGRWGSPSPTAEHAADTFAAFLLRGTTNAFTALMTPLIEDVWLHPVAELEITHG